MPFQLRSVNKPNDEPRVVVYANFKDFLEKAPRDSKYLTHEGVIKPKKFVKKDNFLDLAAEVADGAAPDPVLPVAGNPSETGGASEPKPANPEAKPTVATPRTSMSEKPSAPAPSLNLEQLGKVLSEAISSSIDGISKTTAEAWKKALGDAVDASNNRLKETMDGLSLAYMELGQKVAEALNSGVLDQVADKRFKDLESVLQTANEKALSELRNEKEGVEVIRGEITKVLGNLKALASDIEEDSEDVSRKVKKFKLGTAEMLQQQVEQLQNQLSEVNDEATRLRRELLEIRCSQGKQDPEYIHDLEKKVASLPRLEADIREKDLELQRHELELKTLRALSKDQLKQFRDHQRLEELEALAEGFEREKEEFENRIDETSRELGRTSHNLRQTREEVRLLRESARGTEDLEQSLRDTQELVETLTRSLRDTEHKRDRLSIQLEESELALNQGDDHYRETLLAADRQALLLEFQRKEERFQGELDRRKDALDREVDRNQFLEEEIKKLQARVEQIAAEKLEIQGQVEAGMPQAYQNALAKIKELRLDEERLAALTASCAHHAQTEIEMREKIVALRNDEAALLVEIASLRTTVGELAAEQERLDALKKKIESDRLKIETDLETDPIIGAFDKKTDVSEADWLKDIRNGIRAEGFEISDRLLYSFHTALKCQDISPLTLLMGISGTGKSELPRLYSALGGIHFHLAAVQPNWDSPSDLFGFYNYAEARPKLEPLSRYLLQFLSTVGPDGEQPAKRGDELLLVLLDEMNLARVEYYFSDLLSRLEARRSVNGKSKDRDSLLRASISLDMGASESRHLYLDSNVMFVGTLNQDESTMDVSDKVVDRANVITFPRPKSFCPISTKKPTGTKSRESRLSRQTWDDWCRGGNHGSHDSDELQAKFQKINAALKYVERGVAHRVFQAVQRYVESYPVFAASKPAEAAQRALVDQFAMKILPKLKGVPTDTQDGKACLAGIEGVLPDDLKDDFAHAKRGDFFDWQGCEKLFEIGK